MLKLIAYGLFGSGAASTVYAAVATALPASTIIDGESLLPLGAVLAVGWIVLTQVWKASQTLTQIKDKLRELEATVSRLPCHPNGNGACPTDDAADGN